MLRLYFLFLFALTLWKETFSAYCNQTSSGSCSAVSGCAWNSGTSTCYCAANINMDVIFAVDATSSIGSDAFHTETSYVASICQSYLPPNTHVGFITFASTITTTLDLTTSSSMTASQIATTINNTASSYSSYSGDYSDITGAVLQAISLFNSQSSSQRYKLLVLLTGDNPNSPSLDNDICSNSSVLRSKGIDVAIVGAGSNWDSAYLDCLVPDTSADIISISSFSSSLFTATLPTITQLTCPSTNKLVITEVKPTTDTSGVKFVEIYNPSIPISLSTIKLAGLISGSLNASSSTLNQSQYLILYDGTSSNTPNCTYCQCTLSSFRCTNSLYIACSGSGGISSCAFTTMTNTNFYINVSQSSTLLDSASYSSSSWPTIQTGYSYELIYKGYNNNYGANWKISCSTKGTPGADSYSCTGCSSSLCTLSDSGATCDSSTTTCSCSTTGYFSTGIGCNKMPNPATCKLHYTSSYPYFEWDLASLDTSHTYQLTYMTAKSGSISFTIYARIHTVTNLDTSSLSIGSTAGYVQTYVNGSLLSTSTSCIIAPTVAPTPSPTPAPTGSPIWQNPYVYIGGDICTHSRCNCNGKSAGCTNVSIYKTFSESDDTDSFVKIVKYPSDFPYFLEIEWNITALGNYTSSRRLLQTVTTTTTTTTTTVNPDNVVTTSSIFENISPTNGTLSISQNSSSNSISLSIPKETDSSNSGSPEELFLLKLLSCTVYNSTVSYSCSVVYPSELNMVVLNSVYVSPVTTTVKKGKIAAWVWVLIAILCIALIVAGLFMYRYYHKQKHTKAELADTKDQYNDAIQEIEQGFGGDLDQNAVQFNPMATGVNTNSLARQGGPSNNNDNNNDTSNQRADVAVQKFQHRQELGQIQQGRKKY